jgi:hypothetical protein
MMMNRRQTTYDGDEVIVTYRETTWNEVRVNRDQALLECDWRAGKDVVLSTAWKEYRQALRDLPQDHAESNDAADNWPVAPDE